MSTEPPPGAGPPPEDDPFRKQPPSQDSTPSSGGGSPYGTPPPSEGEDPYGGGPPGDDGPPGTGGPYGGGFGGGGPGGAGPPGGGPFEPDDPLAGMPPLAPSGRRTLARVIDMVIVGVVVWLVSWAFGAGDLGVGRNNAQFGRSFGQSLLAAVLYIAYDTFLISRTGQTLGKRLLAMRVANLRDGSTPAPQTSFARAVVLWLPFAFCCACFWTAVCGGWSYFDRPFRQGLHDKVAKTVVVSLR